MDHKILSRRLGAGLLAVVALQVQSCANLEDVEPGYCGNGVAEPNAGEDCDGNPKGSVCGARGSEHECKFVWDEDPNECVAPYIASPDHRCRQPSYVYQAGIAFQAPGNDPQIGDFDADNQPEVALTGGDGYFSVYSFDDGGSALIAEYPTGGRGAFADLTGDGRADVGFGSLGFAFFRSREGGLDLKFYPSLLFPSYVDRYVPLPTWLGAEPDINDLSVLGLLYVEGTGVRLCTLENDCALSMPVGNAPTTESVRVDYSADHMVISADQQPEILYLSRANATVFPPDPSSFATIRLQGDAKVLGGARLLDVNGDGLEDLVALGESADATSQSLYVFAAPFPAAWLSTDVLVPWVEIANVALFGLFDTSASVFAELNGDGVPDFLLGSYVELSKAPIVDPGGTPLFMQDYYRETWWPRQGGVAVGDVNGDGLDDIVGQVASGFVTQGPDEATQSFPVQVLFGGELMPLVQISIAEAGFLSHVGVVDFDGDGAGDVVGALSAGPPDGGLRSCDQADQLAIAFGRFGGFPEAPVVVGLLSGIEEIATGRFRYSVDKAIDGFGDLAVSARCDDGTGTTSVKAALASGNPYRLVANPLTFESDPGEEFFTNEVFVQDLVTADADSSGVHPDVVVFGLGINESTGIGAFRTFVLPSWDDAEVDTSKKKELTMPSEWTAQLMSPDGGLGAALDVAGTPSRVLVGTTRGDPTDPSPTSPVLAELIVQCLDGSCDSQAISLAPAVPPVFHGLSFVHATTVQLSPATEGLPDFTVVYGSTSPTFDMGGGMTVPEGGPGEPPVVGASFSSVLMVLPSAGGYAPVEVTGFLEGDSPVEVVVAQGQIVVVGRQSLYTLNADATVTPKPNGATFMDVRGAAVLDYNYDRLDDILIVDGFSGLVMLQLPLNPSESDFGTLSDPTIEQEAK